jgi:hypothetical protein
MEADVQKRKVAILAAILLPMGVLLGGADGDGCGTKPDAARQEAASQDIQMEQFLRNQPVPSFDWSLERHMMIQLYIARQRATNTYSYVQSEFTGKLLWSCPSIGFPIPYATQLTNPQKLTSAYGLANSGHYTDGVVSQQEPNGLFSPAAADGTWVPCVDEKGKITPVYEERKVSTFLRPMIETNGTLTPVLGSTASVQIEPSKR